MKFNPWQSPLTNFMWNVSVGGFLADQERQRAKPLERLQAKPLLPRKAQSTATGKPSRQLQPSAAIHRIWVIHNVKHRGQQGMNIHVIFSVDNLLERTGTVAAYFYFTNGVPLGDINGDYCTETGQVSVSRSFMAPYPKTIYKNFVLFMPYLELHMGPGNHSLMFSLSVWDDGGLTGCYLPISPVKGTETVSVFAGFEG